MTTVPRRTIGQHWKILASPYRWKGPGVVRDEYDDPRVIGNLFHINEAWMQRLDFAAITHLALDNLDRLAALTAWSAGEVLTCFIDLTKLDPAERTPPRPALIVPAAITLETVTEALHRLARQTPPHEPGDEKQTVFA